MNLFVSQLVSVTFATVNLPLGSSATALDISSTRKSETLAFKTPPIPIVLVAYPSRPMALATGSFVDINIPNQRLMLNSFEIEDTRSFNTASADFFPEVLM